MCLTIQVLDECLRAISGFNGTEDPFDQKLLNKPFASDCVRTKKISSAPSYGLEDPEIATYKLKACRSGDKEWSEAIENHLPIVLNHSFQVVSYLFAKLIYLYLYYFNLKRYNSVSFCVIFL